jgi:hypothetical protein
MAKKTTARKLTRRDVVVLGAGTVVAAMRSTPASAQDHPSCDSPSVVETLAGRSRGKPRNVLVSYSCCEETKNAILVGVEEPKAQPTRRGKDHLKPLQTRLNYDALEEYCFMIWGLDEEQAKQMSAATVKMFGFAPRAKK